MCTISGCRKPFLGTRFGSYVGFGRTRVCAGIPGTMIGGFGDAAGDLCGDDEELLLLVVVFSLFSLSLDGDRGAELTGDCWGLGWFAPPTIESIEKPIFGFEGTGTTGVGASGIMVGFTGTGLDDHHPTGRCEHRTIDAQKNTPHSHLCLAWIRVDVIANSRFSANKVGVKIAPLSAKMRATVCGTLELIT